jgi:hypothetical protein
MWVVVPRTFMCVCVRHDWPVLRGGSAKPQESGICSLKITPKLVHLTSRVCSSTWPATKHHKELITVGECVRVSLWSDGWAGHYVGSYPAKNEVSMLSMMC